VSTSLLRPVRRIPRAATIIASLFAASVPGLRGQDSAPVFLFSTLAGTPRISGSTDGVGAAARFDYPSGVAVDATGNVYVADDRNGTIRKITAAGVVTTLAGKAGSFGQVDAAGAAARFSAPLSTQPGAPVFVGVPFVIGKAIAAAPDGTLFVADQGNFAVRKISPAGTVTTLAGGSTGNVDDTGPAAQFGSLRGLKVDANGNVLLADLQNETVRRIAPEGNVSTVAGHPWFRFSVIPGQILPGMPPAAKDGDRATATFMSVVDVAVSAAGEIHALDQAFAGAVRRIAADGGVTTIAGALADVSGTLADGSGGDVRFSIPSGLAVDGDGSLLVADLGNRRIRWVARNGTVATVGGGDSGTADGLGANATFLSPFALCVDREGNLYVADTLSHTIRKGTRVRKPTITSQPQDQFASGGSDVTLSVAATSIVPLTYQWVRNGTAIPGATSPSLVLPAAGDTTAGSYVVVVANAAGGTTSNVALVTQQRPPTITRQPVAQSLLGGQTLVLTVSASGASSLSYQWQKDGSNIPGATNATFTLGSVRAEDAGTYRVVIASATGSVTTEAVRVTVNTSRIANLSIRSVLRPGSPLLTLGFVVAGGNKELLTRAVGPGLRQFNVETAHADPRMALYSGDLVLGSNDDWPTAPNVLAIVDASRRVGAFGLPAGSADAAILSSVLAGAYTAQISGPANREGIVLVELYDANSDVASRLVNVSTRGQVGTGDDLLVGGFVITGNGSKTLLIRAIGPTLAGFGVAGTLVDPRLDLFAAGGTAPLVGNDNWGGARELTDAFAAVGAFALGSNNSGDAVLLVTLDPGSYSAQVSGVGGTVGEALLEIYEVR